MSESIKRREEVLREVRRHIEHYKVAWDRIGRYGGSGRAALDVLEDISQREGDIPSMDDTEEVEEAEAEIKHLREILKTLDNHDKIEPLFAEQEKQMREVYAIQANCGKKGEIDIVDAINPLIDGAYEYAEAGQTRHMGTTLVNKQHTNWVKENARRKQERREVASRGGPSRRKTSLLSHTEVVPRTPSPAAEQALAKARRSGGGFRAGLRYFGWHY
ncbi:hypothetical protein NBRC10512v2_007863 [Rhodotorula toruloides]|uniref:Uncharacterized protein n=1 Tax=Rhodotorula toruloides (strain NP11) TaxID=1130832 RepID=M7WJT3_RHOT1|nr:uncharacterized protein RHTO_06511 [Rhodotorula toruloides NP11]EMS18286.1 hypothetical protein RHTO_06511 [Rhodotorula toruloides NP11]